MPRTVRPHFPNQYYHVFNRGFDRKKIFVSLADYYHFLQKLVEINQTYDWIIYSYCLMPNHYHLQVQVRKDSLSRIIHVLQTSHAVYFNKNHKRTSSLFTNRFKSILVQKDSYHLALSKYIHMNPVKAKIVSSPQEYTYSSYGEIIGSPSHPFGIIDRRAIKSLFNPAKVSAIKEYRNYVEDRKDSYYSPDIAVRGIVGSIRFRAQFE